MIGNYLRRGVWPLMLFLCAALSCKALVGTPSTGGEPSSGIGCRIVHGRAAFIMAALLFESGQLEHITCIGLKILQRPIRGQALSRISIMSFLPTLCSVPQFPM